MAAKITIASGITPNAPSTGNLTLFAPNANAVDANGSSLRRRVFALTEETKTLQLSDSRLHNFIRNGGFWFAQRQAPGSATTYSNTTGRSITADGWGITNENASVTYARFDTSGSIQTNYQSRYYGEFLKITSTGKMVISQVLEGTDSQALRNCAVRLTVWIKASGVASLTLRMGLLYVNNSGTVDAPPATFVSAFGAASTDPTFGTNVSKATGSSSDDNTTAMTNNAFTIAATSAWQRFSGAFSVPNDVKNLIPTIWTDGQPAATQGFDMGQCMLTQGAELQDWSPHLISIEQARVQRFYQKSFAIDTNPATNAGAATGEYHAIAGKAGAVANAGFIPVRMQVPMRAAAGITLYNPQAANAQVRDQTGAVDHSASSVSAGAAGFQEFLVTSTGNAATAVGDQIGIHWSADAEI